MGASVHRKPGKRDVWRVVIDLGNHPTTGKRKRMVRQVHGLKKDAQAELARIRNDMTTGQWIAPSKLTMEAFLNRWLDYMANRLAPSALASYQSIVRNRLIPDLGGVLVQSLQTMQVIAVEKRWLKSGRLSPSKQGPRSTGGLSSKTVLNYHRVLVEALNDAVRWELVRGNVADTLHMEPPRVDRSEHASLSFDESMRLLRVLPDERHGAALYTLIMTGLRLGELLALRWRDVDLDGRALSVVRQYDRVAKAFRDTKSHRNRRPVALDAELVAVLRRHRAEQEERQARVRDMWEAPLATSPCTDGCHGLVFTDDLGHHLKHDVISHALERSLRAAGLGHLGPHGLRHTHASMLVQLGTHMRVIQERLGHASFAITADTYCIWHQVNRPPRPTRSVPRCVRTGLRPF